jgi:3-dehydroquinate dehydratase/shikimate dehydrogenase
LYAGQILAAPGQLDPEMLKEIYRWGEMDPYFALYGFIGNSSVVGSFSPGIHNRGFSAAHIQAICVPLPIDDLKHFFTLTDTLNLRGFSVTAPFKEKILPYLTEHSPAVEAVGACNTVVRTTRGWVGYNTDYSGFERDVLRFLNLRTLKGIKACVVGAGGAACAVTYALKTLGAKVCVINRTMAKAKELAGRYGFLWSGFNERAVELLSRYNDLIVQTTSVGMEGGPQGDPLEFYEFDGNESVYETIYRPSETSLLARAREAGCRVSNGLGMLYEQTKEQFELFTGHTYPEIDMYSKFS